MASNKKIQIQLSLPLLALILLTALFFEPAPTQASASSTFWQTQCIDTMKDSRDNARNWVVRSDLAQLVARQISAVKNTGANCVAIGTPYNDEFAPFMKVWVDEIHKQGMKVWFRGNVAGWEGWFGYPILASVDEHHQQIAHFITFHPNFFQDGDIFTPAPEPEAGKLIGDPRSSDVQKTEYLNFLVDSYSNCQKAFSQIGIKAVCGYFSTNGDIAKYVLTPDVVSKIGNVVVVDHYVSDPSGLVNDLVDLHNKFQTKIILGEFGAPVPDLNGNMTEDQQAAFIDTVYKGLVAHRDFIVGVNYWVLSDGSSALYNSDFTPRKAVTTIKNYYSPAVVQGTVSNSSGTKLAGASVKLANSPTQATTDQGGNFSVAVPAGQSQIVVDSQTYNQNTTSVSATSGQQISKNITLEPKGQGWFSRFWTFIKHLFGH
jgi:hypothetical protein